MQLVKSQRSSLLHLCKYSCSIYAKVLCHSNVSQSQTAELKRTFTSNDVKQFSDVTGDHNPVHFDKVYAEKLGFSKPIVHGALLNGLVSAVIGNVLPGPGTLVAKQMLNFPQPLFVGEAVTARVEVLSRRKSIVSCSFVCETEDGRRVMYGNATLVVKNS